MILMEQIRERIAEAIKQSKYNQSEIAHLLNIRHQQVSCYALGKKLPAIDTLANFCKVLDLDANYILCLTD